MMEFDWGNAFLCGWGVACVIVLIGVGYLLATILEGETGFPVWASMLIIAVVVAAAVCGGLGVFP